MQGLSHLGLARCTRFASALSLANLVTALPTHASALALAIRLSPRRTLAQGGEAIIWEARRKGRRKRRSQRTERTCKLTHVEGCGFWPPSVLNAAPKAARA